MTDSFHMNRRQHIVPQYRIKKHLHYSDILLNLPFLE